MGLFENKVNPSSSCSLWNLQFWRSTLFSCPKVYHEDFVFDNKTDVHDAKMAIKKAMGPWRSWWASSGMRVYPWPMVYWFVVGNHGILWLSHHLGNVIIPTDKLIIFQRGRSTTKQYTHFQTKPHDHSQRTSSRVIRRNRRWCKNVASGAHPQCSIFEHLQISRICSKQSTTDFLDSDSPPKSERNPSLVLSFLNPVYLGYQRYTLPKVLV